MITLVNWNTVNNTILNDRKLLQVRFTSAHYPFPLRKQISLKLLPKAIYKNVVKYESLNSVYSTFKLCIRHLE